MSIFLTNCLTWKNYTPIFLCNLLINKRNNNMAYGLLYGLRAN